VSPPTTTTTKKEENKDEVTVAVVAEPAAVEEEDKEPSKPIQKNKGRCFSCRIKVRNYFLVGFSFFTTKFLFLSFITTTDSTC
jgi:hypothetical protein